MTITEESKLVKKQFRAYGPKEMRPNGAHITATVRFDDECKNGHNSFGITGSTTDGQGGCIHDLIAEHFPELAPFIKWHLCSTDGPMHYVANTVYWTDEHGPTHAWIYYQTPRDPLGIEGAKERLLGYEKAATARMAEMTPGYRVQWDEKTTKVRNLAYARSSAIWPDATDEDLTAPGLKERLEARLPALLAEFRKAVESLGFVW